MKVGYLGPTASFTHTATMQAFPEQELVSFHSIPACIKAVESGKVNIGVVPIENTIEGTVNTTLDYLYHQAQLPVGAEIVLPISQQFMVNKLDQQNWKETTCILSHPQAIAQCERFINENFPTAQIEATPSTAYAADFVAKHPRMGYASIAPRLSAEVYHLDIVKENIQDIELNKTRFWVLGSKNISVPLPVEKQKISLSITMPNNMPGALHKALSVFSWRQINLSKIESRPLKTILGEYFFLIDIINDVPKDLIHNAIQEIELLGGKVKIFGNYSIHVVEAI